MKRKKFKVSAEEWREFQAWKNSQPSKKRKPKSNKPVNNVRMSKRSKGKVVFYAGLSHYGMYIIKESNLKPDRQYLLLGEFKDYKDAQALLKEGTATHEEIQRKLIALTSPAIEHKPEARLGSINDVFIEDTLAKLDNKPNNKEIKLQKPVINIHKRNWTTAKLGWVNGVETWDYC